MQVKNRDAMKFFEEINILKKRCILMKQRYKITALLKQLASISKENSGKTISFYWLQGQVWFLLEALLVILRNMLWILKSFKGPDKAQKQLAMCVHRSTIVMPWLAKPQLCPKPSCGKSWLRWAEYADGCKTGIFRLLCRNFFAFYQEPLQRRLIAQVQL